MLDLQLFLGKTIRVSRPSAAGNGGECSHPEIAG